MDGSVYLRCLELLKHLVNAKAREAGQEKRTGEDTEMDSKSTTKVRKANPVAEIELQSDWSWVEPLVWTNRMLTALENGVKGGRWHSLIDKVYKPEVLAQAWLRVRKNKGAAGVDQVSIKRFEAHSSRYLEELSQKLKSGSYIPHEVRRVYISKPNGQQRPLGIPTVKDRIVQMALKMVLEPIFEYEFESRSYGFRPGRGCKDALREVDHCLKAGYCWVVDADLKSYFDTIPHDSLKEEIRRRVSDQKILGLIDGFLNQAVLDGLERWTPNMGSPQGAVISPLLSNIYLHQLDQKFTEAGYRWVRYADDFVVLCKTEEEASRALREIQLWLSGLELELNPSKTRVGDCRVSGEGFDFLGYRFEAGKRWVCKKSLKSIMDKIRAKTTRSRGDKMSSIIDELNPMLRGWFEYFKHANGWVYQKLDGFVRRRLRAIRRKQTNRAGFGSNLRDHKLWPNIYFAKLGLFTMAKARVSASQSRRGNS